jgi:pimeloyl-ACP methyl ester carboxylesterase
MSDGSDTRRLLRDVEEAFATLPQRYLGAERDMDACVQVRLGDFDRTWQIELTPTQARVRPGASGRSPDVVIGTDAATWMALRTGEISGVEAFRRRAVRARGDLDLAVAFEGLFRLPNGREPLLRVHEVRLSGRTVSVLTMGEGPDVLLLHGLGGTKSSFFETAGVLARDGYRVHALDLPGFGASSKPLTAPYSASWFAATVLETMDAMGVDAAFLVGNSMGGRVALEVALRAPERVHGVALLCPAVAFVKRQFHPIVRLLRPEVSLLPHAIPRALVARQFWSLFEDREAIDPALAEVVVDGFRKTYSSPGGRHAFLASARNLYLDAPWGRTGFYPRLAELDPPALFVWGSHDRLIPAAFSRIVAQWLPGARQVVLEGCGHVPQVERAPEVNALLIEFFGACASAQSRDPRRAAA